MEKKEINQTEATAQTTCESPLQDDYFWRELQVIVADSMTEEAQEL